MLRQALALALVGLFCFTQVIVFFLFFSSFICGVYWDLVLDFFIFHPILFDLHDLLLFRHMIIIIIINIFLYLTFFFLFPFLFLFFLSFFSSFAYLSRLGPARV